ncbi:Transporter of the ATP-binding cassette (ABC), partial [Coemansia thaxteri]
FLTDEKHELCGSQSQWVWWSLDSDCFRTGFLWPALLLLAAGSASAALAASLLLPGRWQSSNGFCSVGNREKPMRRPPGPVIVQDNRIQVGSTVVVLSVIQAALLVFGWRYDRSNANFALAYSAIAAQLAVLIALASAAFLAVYIRSNSMVYAGLFPWPLPTLVLLQLVVALCEIYYSFFTPDTRHVPISGREASLHSNMLVLTTLISALLYFNYLRAQLRPVFVRPLSNSASSLDFAEGVTADSDVGAYSDDTTPLAPRTAQKPAALVDSSEFNASWYSTLAVSWTNGLISRGAKNRLEPTDLYRLDESDLPIPNWKRYMHYRKPGRSLMVTILMTFAPEFLLHALLTVITAVLRFSGPFFLQRIMHSIQLLRSSKGDLSFQPAEKSIRSTYLDAFGLLFCTLVASVTSNQTSWVGRRISIRLKGILVAELSTKTLQRGDKGLKANADGKAGPAADGKIMNLLTADFSRVTEVAACLDRLYSMPLVLVIGTWYMYRLLGVPALIGLAVSAIYIQLSKSIFKHLTKIEKKLSSLGDERMTLINELFKGIKAVKLFGWESRFMAKIDEKREHQLQYMWNLRLAWVQVTVASMLIPMLVLAMIFAVHIIVLGNQLTAEVAFTSMSVFGLIRGVSESMPGYLNWIIGTSVSLDRIHSFFEQSPVQDLKSRIATHADRSSADNTREVRLGFEHADLEWESPSSSAKPDSKSVVDNDAPTGVEATSADSLDTSESDTEQTPLLAAGGATDSTHMQIELASASESASTSVNSVPRFSLKDIDVQFPHGALSIVAGPTGSGKSSLLSALIGEMTLTRGRIHLPTTNSGLTAGDSDKYRDIIELSDEGLAIRKIAYVAQEAWLRNATIRENILFGEQYEKSRYEEVLRV